MTDAELVRWLSQARVIIVARQQQLEFERPTATDEVDQAFDVLARTYDPCRAPRWDLCLYCPWESCRRAAEPAG